MKLLNKLKRQFGASYSYYKYCKNESVDPNMILLEAGQGKNKNGNMFALVRELSENPKWKNMKTVFVVTNDNLEEVKAFYASYNYKVHLVVRNSREYCKFLATAKYLVTDNSFPPYFYKREGQVYLNTWHGTPLKTLGKSDIKNAKSMANIQKNYLMCDYALFPNEFTENVFKKDYMLEKIYSGKIILCDYPRNSVLLKPQVRDDVRRAMQLDGKKVTAYMPTWRGAQRKADIDEQINCLTAYFDEIDQKLNDDELFYVNLHFLIGNVMDLSRYKHIYAFPAQYETYDFLAACDLLVTDYSSVFFDFAVTGRKVILFPYDYDAYMAERGTYMRLDSLPFAQVYNTDDLIREMRTPSTAEKTADFLHTYCRYAQADIPEKILKLLVEHDKTDLVVKPAWQPDAQNVLVYCGNLQSNQLNRYLADYVRAQCRANPDKNYILCFRGRINAKVIDFMEEIGTCADFLALAVKYEIPLLKKLLFFASSKTSLGRKAVYCLNRKDYIYERNRLFYGINPSAVVNAAGKQQYMNYILAQFACKKTFIIHSNFLIGRRCLKKNYRNMLRAAAAIYDEVLDNRNADAKPWWAEEEKETFYNRDFYIRNLTRRFKNGKKGMQLCAIAQVESMAPFALSDLRVELSEIQYDFNCKTLLKTGKHKRLVYYKLFFPYKDMQQVGIQNRVNLYYTDADGYGLKAPVRYKWRRNKKRGEMHGPIQVFEETNTSMYFRQTRNNLLYLTIRKINISDRKNEQFKLWLAYWLARFTPPHKVILLFEKEGSRYEESASVLYEALIDEGYHNAYFVLNKHYPYFDNIAKKYRRHILFKGSFKHYYCFFKSKTFLGSESLVHSIDLRVANKWAQRKLTDPDKDYVFLQHGVMYMVSLDSESRKFFKPNRLKGKYRVVTSSHEEARHFVELGGYSKDMIYICGLPKFDRNVREASADKIVIMLTWRPWEYNEARYDFAQTKYYKMLCRIFDGIPHELRDKIVILPHPLFFDAAKHAQFPMKKYFDCNTKYDDILKKAKVLITDYSSISYDAFYRGTNVIFYWEEKDDCLAMYGPSTKLMLNHENAFGDICYSTQDLENVIWENYGSDQKQEYVSRYRKLVEFHDGKNTKRLIELMAADEII